MTKFLPILLLFTLSCGKSGNKSNQESSLGFLNPNEYDLITDADPVPQLAETFKVNIVYVNFTEAQKAKYEKAVEILKQVVASEEFKQQVLNYTYDGSMTFNDNGGMSNSAIYMHMLNGNESLQPARNNQIDVEIELYYAATTTVGYTYPNSKRIWVNTKYFDTYSPASVAGNLYHEWLHKLGYIHASSFSPSRDFTVPYGIGRIMSSLGKQYEN